MACVLSAMLMMRVLNENVQIDKINRKVFCDKPIPASAKPTNMKPIVKGTRLSNFETSQPENGNPISELMGMNSSIVPSSASLNPKEVLIVGIRDAHDAKQNPDRKKNILNEKRCLFLE